MCYPLLSNCLVLPQWLASSLARAMDCGWEATREGDDVGTNHGARDSSVLMLPKEPRLLSLPDTNDRSKIMVRIIAAIMLTPNTKRYQRFGFLSFEGTKVVILLQIDKSLQEEASVLSKSRSKPLLFRMERNREDIALEATTLS